MTFRFEFFVFWVLSCAMLSCFTPAMGQPRVIFDTDAMTDVDDIGALAVLHALADRGEVHILATIVSAKHEYAAPAVQVVNEYYGRPAIPVGALLGPGVHLNSNYKAQTLAKRFLREPILLTSQRIDAVRLYREILAASDEKVIIMTIGYATNLRDLLESGPDEFSPLTGKELVAARVEKWVNMGGNFENRRRADGFPHDMNNTNVNWERDPQAAITAIENWPTEIVYVGREIGHSLRVGAALKDTPADNPVRVAYELFFGGEAKDHHCADLSTVLYAVRGLGSGNQRYWELETGRISMKEGAKFSWETGDFPGRKEARLVDALTRPDAGLLSLPEVEKVISDLLIAAPQKRPLPEPPAVEQVDVSTSNGKLVLSWPAAGRDVACYRVYRGEQVVGTAYGTRFIIEENDDAAAPLAIRAVNAAGTEGRLTRVILREMAR